MSGNLCSLEALSSSFQVHSKPSNISSSPPEHKASQPHATHFNFQKFKTLAQKAKVLSNKTVLFHFEEALLKSSASLFPYFLLVAFEAGGLLRAMILFLLSPLVFLVGGELGLNIMVFLCFCGIRKDRMRVGTAVLPKFFLEDVGSEGLDVVMRCGKKVGVSELPRVMVEGLLKDYVGVDVVVARELKVVAGYFVGLMEEKKTNCFDPNVIFGEEIKTDSQTIGIIAEKQNWKTLAKQKYPKPLIFHDGRLAFFPTPAATLAMFMYFPLGIFICIIRFLTGIFLPHSISSPILAFTGTITTISKPKSPISLTNDAQKQRGRLYVCNHRTLLDPLYVQLAIDKSLSAVTYSLSKVNEKIAPMKTIGLTRDRERDAKTMEKLLQQGDLVVCPEGTTCREPYLLRFSPLFAELTDDIVPVAIDVKVNMFYGTCASGFKSLDPVFHFMNPHPVYTLQLLDKLPEQETCNLGGKSRFEVANHVQNEIGKALGFESTGLTRKDKYMVLAGNDGSLKSSR
ncbi:glycerol-3-phosphate acyltransferase 3 [Pyrus ussuriensis x Pyrus communis]|uniref:Glycerol-3-phosphate acyltransferase 3 n=1 Tax=Pyrus ussuriensis x Pyrus communis TaxID=2448454 RepID=A0A5N5GI28_9ROSA|nr:glycerol-3-phosphate acyltransferase 3 [Pyrus ussuriensis x Pyrus communis]